MGAPQPMISRDYSAQRGAVPIMRGPVMAKTNVHYIGKQEPPKSKRRKVKAPQPDIESVQAFFEMPDEDPQQWKIAASDVYRDYEFYCVDEGIKPAKPYHFRLVAVDYCDKVKERDGKTYYSPKPELLEYLEDVKPKPVHPLSLEGCTPLQGASKNGPKNFKGPLSHLIDFIRLFKR
ncbi:MAG: hypothetical protein DHS20C08_04400 [Rhodomicrobium sp.]|nr:MAG: hypothetical protein DHS20C08_04400 [Rhodomicrobium sp.]